MAEPTESPLGRVRNSEYTGTNRCVPCTVVNVAIAAVGSALVALVSPELAAVLFAGSLLVVYLRGYLVPGTPTLTKRYLPDRVRALFDDHPAEARGTGEEWETLEKVAHHRENAVDVDRFLADADVVVPTGDGDRRRLAADVTDVLARRGRERTADDVDRETVAAMFDADTDEVSVQDRDYPAFTVGRRVRTWPSETALVADVVAHEFMADRTERWADVPLEQRREMLGIVRSYVESCPACGAALEQSTDTVESCCGVHSVVALTCTGCGDRLLERSPDALASTRLTRG